MTVPLIALMAIAIMAVTGKVVVTRREVPDRIPSGRWVMRYTARLTTHGMVYVIIITSAAFLVQVTR